MYVCVLKGKKLFWGTKIISLQFLLYWKVELFVLLKYSWGLFIQDLKNRNHHKTLFLKKALAGISITLNNLQIYCHKWDIISIRKLQLFSRIENVAFLVDIVYILSKDIPIH